MKDIGIVRGSEEQAKDIVIGFDTVYIHSDIKKLPKENEQDSDIWEYHEVQYDKNEYIEMMAKTNKEQAIQMETIQEAMDEFLLR